MTSSFLDNNLVKIAIAAVAFYFLWKTLSDNKSNTIQENLTDTPITVGASAAGTANQTLALPTANTPVAPVLTVVPSQQLLVQSPTTNILTPMQPLTSNTAITTTTSTPAPATTDDTGFTMVTDADMQAVVGVDTGRLLDNRSGAANSDDHDIYPVDLVPKLNKDADLFAQFKTDPKYDQNFLQNRFSAGLDASTTTKRYVNDLRGGLPVPFATTESFNNPTQFPDLWRKGLGDV